MAYKKEEPDTQMMEQPVVVPERQRFKMTTDSIHLDYYAKNGYEDYTASLFAHTMYERDLFIDIGAHHGYYSLLQSASNDRVAVMAFEPSPDNFALLNKNIELNRFNNIQAYNMAVSDVTGVRNFNITTRSSHCGFYQHNWSETVKTIEMKTVAIDEFIKLSDYKSIVIKIDTEGNEISVLKGMQRLLREVENVLLYIEFNPSLLISAGYEPEQLLTLMNSQGYDTLFINDEKKVTYKITENRTGKWKDYFGCSNYEKDYFNLFCVKREKSFSICFMLGESGGVNNKGGLLENAGYWISNCAANVTAVLPSKGLSAEDLVDKGVSVVAGDIIDEEKAESSGGDTGVSAPAKTPETNVFEVLNEIDRINPDIIVSDMPVMPWGVVCSGAVSRPHVLYISERPVFDSRPITQFVVELSDMLLVDSAKARDMIRGKVNNIEDRKIGIKTAERDSIYSLLYPLKGSGVNAQKSRYQFIMDIIVRLMTDMKDVYNDKAMLISSLNAEIGRLKQNVVDREAQINSISGSITWKQAQKLHRVIDRLLPPGSGRRQLAGKMLRVLSPAK